VPKRASPGTLDEAVDFDELGGDIALRRSAAGVAQPSTWPYSLRAVTGSADIPRRACHRHGEQYRSQGRALDGCDVGVRRAPVHVARPRASAKSCTVRSGISPEGRC
jgi:hypothetical protein